MNILKNLNLHLGLLLLLLGFQSVNGQKVEPQKQPNIIWLMAEDIGLDIECYGMQAVKTPSAVNIYRCLTGLKSISKN